MEEQQQQQQQQPPPPQEISIYDRMAKAFAGTRCSMRFIGCILILYIIPKLREFCNEAEHQPGLQSIHTYFQNLESPNQPMYTYQQYLTFKHSILGTVVTTSTDIATLWGHILNQFILDDLTFVFGNQVNQLTCEDCFYSKSYSFGPAFSTTPFSLYSRYYHSKSLNSPQSSSSLSSSSLIGENEIIVDDGEREMERKRMDLTEETFKALVDEEKFEQRCTNSEICRSAINNGRSTSTFKKETLFSHQPEYVVAVLSNEQSYSYLQMMTTTNKNESVDFSASEVKLFDDVVFHYVFGGCEYDLFLVFQCDRRISTEIGVCLFVYDDSDLCFSYPFVPSINTNHDNDDNDDDNDNDNGGGGDDDNEGDMILFDNNDDDDNNSDDINDEKFNNSNDDNKKNDSNDNNDNNNGGEGVEGREGDADRETSRWLRIGRGKCERVTPHYVKQNIINKLGIFVYRKSASHLIKRAVKPKSQ